MATADFFLKIDGIEGESDDARHKDKIEIESFSFGETQAAASGAGGAGKVSIEDFLCSMRVNKATPKLYLACATGEHFKKAVLTDRKAAKDQSDYLKWTLTDVLVAGFHRGGNATASPVPADRISLSFARVEIEYKEMKPDGSLGAAVKAGWDTKQDKSV